MDGTGSDLHPFGDLLISANLPHYFGFLKSNRDKSPKDRLLQWHLETDRNSVSVSVSAPKTAILSVSASFVFGRILIYDFRQIFGFGRKSSVVSAECRKFTLQ